LCFGLLVATLYLVDICPSLKPYFRAFQIYPLSMSWAQKTEISGLCVSYIFYTLNWKYVNRTPAIEDAMHYDHLAILGVVD